MIELSFFAFDVLRILNRSSRIFRATSTYVAIFTTMTCVLPRKRSVFSFSAHVKAIFCEREQRNREFYPCSTLSHRYIPFVIILYLLELK